MRAQEVMGVAVLALVAFSFVVAVAAPRPTVPEWDFRNWGEWLQGWLGNLSWGKWPSERFFESETMHRTFEVTSEQIKTISIDMGAGEVTLRERDGVPTIAIEADGKDIDGKVTEATAISGKTEGSIDVEIETADVTLYIARGTPIELLRIDAGVGSVMGSATLGAPSSIWVNAGVGAVDLQLTVPSDAAVSVDASSGLGTATVTGEGLQVSTTGNTVRATAEGEGGLVSITVQSGLGSVDIHIRRG